MDYLFVAVFVFFCSFLSAAFVASNFYFGGEKTKRGVWFLFFLFLFFVFYSGIEGYFLELFNQRIVFSVFLALVCLVLLRLLKIPDWRVLFSVDHAVFTAALLAASFFVVYFPGGFSLMPVSDGVDAANHYGISAQLKTNLLTGAYGPLSTRLPYEPGFYPFALHSAIANASVLSGVDAIFLFNPLIVAVLFFCAWLASEFLGREGLEKSLALSLLVVPASSGIFILNGTYAQMLSLPFLFLFVFLHANMEKFGRGAVFALCLVLILAILMTYGLALAVVLGYLALSAVWAFFDKNKVDFFSLALFAWVVFSSAVYSLLFWNGFQGLFSLEASLGGSGQLIFLQAGGINNDVLAQITPIFAFSGAVGAFLAFKRRRRFIPVALLFFSVAAVYLAFYFAQMFFGFASYWAAKNLFYASFPVAVLSALVFSELLVRRLSWVVLLFFLALSANWLFLFGGKTPVMGIGEFELLREKGAELAGQRVVFVTEKRMDVFWHPKVLGSYWYSPLNNDGTVLEIPFAPAGEAKLGKTEARSLLFKILNFSPSAVFSGAVPLAESVEFKACFFKADGSGNFSFYLPRNASAGGPCREYPVAMP